MHSLVNSNETSCTIGLDVGGTKMLGGIVVFPEGKALVKKVMPTRPERPGQEVLDDALKFVEELMAEVAVRNLSVSGIGVGVAELVDLEGNVTSGHTIAWRDLSIKATFSKLAPTVVESDVRAAALAEVHFGAGRPFHLFIYLTVGTGISYCLVQNGQPFAGARGNALIVGSGRFTTICPHCGEEFAPILEEIASGPAVVSRYNQQAATQALAAEDVLKAAESGDQKAIEILGTAGDALGTSTGFLVNLLDPHAIIVGGGLGLAGGIFWERFIASTCRHIWADSSRNTPILRATTGTDSGMIGAAIAIYAHKLNIHNPKTKRNLIKSVPMTRSIDSRTPRLIIYKNPEELGQQLAFDVLAGINQAKHEGRRYLLGCPGGRSLRSTYNALGKLARQTGTDLSHLVIVMMDEYLIATEQGLVFCPQDAHYSCHRFAREEIRNVLNQRRPKEQKVPEHHIWFPNPANPPAYDERLKQAGNIDLFVIASGASDGHVGFNPPGSELNSGTRVIRLADSTRSDNMRTFPSFINIDEVPTYGISVGLGTISQLSRKVVLVIHSAQKQNAVQRLAECSDFTPDWPASVIFLCRNARVLLDEEAAGNVGVERLQTSFDT